MNKPDPDPEVLTTAERHRKLLLILTAVGILVPLALAALRILGHI